MNAGNIHDSRKRFIVNKVQGLVNGALGCVSRINNNFSTVII